MKFKKQNKNRLVIFCEPQYKDSIIISWIGEEISEEVGICGNHCSDHYIEDVPREPGFHLWEGTIEYKDLYNDDYCDAEPIYTGKWRKLTDKELKDLSKNGTI